MEMPRKDLRYVDQNEPTSLVVNELQPSISELSNLYLNFLMMTTFSKIRIEHFSGEYLGCFYLGKLG